MFQFAFALNMSWRRTASRPRRTARTLSERGESCADIYFLLLFLFFLVLVFLYDAVDEDDDVRGRRLTGVVARGVMGDRRARSARKFSATLLLLKEMRLGVGRMTTRGPFLLGRDG